MTEQLTAAQLGDHLQAVLVPASADIAIRRAVSWLADASGRTDLSATALPADLWGDALELAGIAYDNPTSRASEQVGSSATSWPIASRRDQILDAVRARYGRSRTPEPTGSFPPAPAYPDPAVGRVRWAQPGTWGW